MVRLIAIGMLYAAGVFAQDWTKLDFLLGKWVGVAGDKDTPLGAGQGGFSFELDLDKKVIVRRNRAEYDKGVRHEDLMVIYMEGSPRAIYFDSEGHTIRYNLTIPAKDQVVFDSDGTQPGPKYRLMYWMEKRVLKGKFEVAAPGTAEFKSYMNWSSTKR